MPFPSMVIPFFLMCVCTLCVTGVSHAAGSHIIFLVEKPYGRPNARPSLEQMLRASAIRDGLTERALQLQVDGYVLIDGRNVAENGSAKIFETVPMIVQVTLDVTNAGYEIKAHLYDKTRGEWFPITEKVFGDLETQQVVTAVSDELFPQMLVRIFEVAQLAQRPLLFADCLLPTTEESNLQQVARTFSVQYANILQASSGLQKKFGVVRLVPTVNPEFYTWWCLHLRVKVPRHALLREDTSTIYGLIENLSSKPTLSLEIQQPGRSVTSDTITLDIQNRQETLRQIRQTVEGLTNGM